MNISRIFSPAKASTLFLSFLVPLNLCIFCLFSALCCLTVVSADPVRPGTTSAALTSQPQQLKHLVILTVLPLKSASPPYTAESDCQFGVVSALQSAPIEHTFILRNDNPIPVTLDHLQPSCGCTTAVAGAGEADHVIVPSKILQVHVSIDPNRLSAGLITKTVWVYVKGQPDPAATLQMIGTMQAAVTFSPTFLDFGKVARGETPSRLLTMTLDPQLASVAAPHLSLSNSDLQVTEESTSNADADNLAKPDDLTKPSGLKRTVFTYRLTLLPQSHLGQMSGMIALTPPTDGSAPIHALQVVSVPIVGEVVGELSASPSAVAFGTITKGQPVTLILILTATSLEALRNMSVRSLTPTITAQLSEVPSLQLNGVAVPLTSLQRVLKVTAGPDSSVGSLQTQVIVTTGHNQELVLPVFLSVIAPAVH